MTERFHRTFEAGQSAVVTGAALGIGRALVRDLAARGMRVFAVDVNEAELAKTAAEADGAVTAVVADVSDDTRMKALADQTGPIRFLANNAVTRMGRGFDAPLDEWRQAVEVNLWGVIHGVRAFLPQMQAGMIVNVGSKQGITNPPGHPIYNLCKAAIKSYTEGLVHELRGQGSDVSAHLLVPGWTTTGHAEHKPGAWTPQQVVDHMMAALAREDFYIICPDGEVTEKMDRERIRWGAGDITENRPALSRWHPDWAERAKREMGEQSS